MLLVSFLKLPTETLKDAQDLSRPAVLLKFLQDSGVTTGTLSTLSFFFLAAGHVTCDHCVHSPVRMPQLKVGG